MPTVSAPEKYSVTLWSVTGTPTLLPNPASAALHAVLGFRQVGLLTKVGWKHGRWHDVALLERSLGDDPYAGPPPGGG